MKLKQPLLIAGVVSTVALTSAAGASSVFAATSSSDPQDNLISKIAEKFNLNKDDVQAVFDEQRAAREAEIDQKVEDKLSQLVTDGKLTEDQKSKILAKRDELKKQREAEIDKFKDMTHDERKAAKETKRTELESWAKENNIPTEYLHFVFGGGRGHHGGPGGFGGREKAENSTSSASGSTSSTVQTD